MCGIGGILRTDGQPIPEEWLDAIDARIAYRGPDGHGRFRDRVEIDDPSAPAGRRVVEVAFVHRRLSIIDHKDGHQPMVSERGRNDSEGLVAVVFNGCIYNHRELRKELEGKGHTFVTDHSDTEVLIHGWREWGTNLAEHLEGMYAFALWDRNRHALLLERDRFGEKPLYFREGPGFNDPCMFASDAACIAHLHTTFLQRPSPTEWSNMYLRAGYNQYGWTVFTGSTSENGHELFRGVRNWSPHYLQDRLGPCSPAEVEILLERAVTRRLEADVPLGCFLSGGVDSSLVAYFAKRHKKDLQTFSVRMPDPPYDESHHAELVAKKLNIAHTTLEVAMNPAVDLIKLIEVLGQPFGDSSILPTYWVSKAARSHVKVALSGDGGDEFFFGYDRYVAADPIVRHRKFLARLPSFFLKRTHPKSAIHKIGRVGEMARDFDALGLAATESIFTREEIFSLTGALPNPIQRAHIQHDTVAKLRQFDICHYLPGDLLTKVDTASMACALEVRCPFLDRDLTDAVRSMPIDQLMPNGQRKGLLRNIARKYLPKEIVDRPKMGFAIPISEWFRDDDLPHKGSGMKTLLLDHLNSAEPFGPIQLNRKAVQRFIDEHMSGKRDHGQRLFTLLTLSIWAKQTQKSRNAEIT